MPLPPPTPPRATPSSLIDTPELARDAAQASRAKLLAFAAELDELAARARELAALIGEAPQPSPCDHTWEVTGGESDEHYTVVHERCTRCGEERTTETPREVSRG